MRRNDVYCRHKLYRSSIFWLIAEFERDNRTFHTALVGHLGDRRDPLKPLASAQVRMVSGGRVVASAVTDHQGDFKLEYELAPDTALSILAGDRELARVQVV